jgi:hypothetical protein
LKADLARRIPVSINKLKILKIQVPVFEIWPYEVGHSEEVKN